VVCEESRRTREAIARGSISGHCSTDMPIPIDSSRAQRDLEVPALSWVDRSGGLCRILLVRYVGHRVVVFPFCLCIIES
jgi:hypothetical protein